MVDGKVGFGVIGLGMGASRALQVANTAGAQLVAVADLDERRGKQAQADHGCEFFPDYRQMLERDDIDVVLVMTPSGTHMEVGTVVAAAGKHVATTKPIDVTLENADKLISACADANVVLAVDFESRYAAGNQKIKAAVDQGIFGKIILGEVRLKWYRAQSYFENSWRGTWEMDGGGSLMNQCVHWIDVLQWFLGDVESVNSQTGIFAHEIETEDLTTSLVRFRNGAFGTILSTTTFPDSRPATVEIHGDRGGAVAVNHEIDYWQHKLSFNDETDAQDADDFAFSCDGPANIVEDMIGVVLENKTPAVTGEEGRKSIEIVLSIYESAKRGEPVTLPLCSCPVQRG
jgi:predicted dehydrogenase